MEKISTNDRRKLKRQSISYYMLVMDATAGKTIGHLVDITAKGFMMDTQFEFPVNKLYRLRLDTTADVADKSYIEFTAMTKWSAPDAVELGLFDIGFQIIKIAPADADIVTRIINKYGARDSLIS
jgi:hypothetical protein